MGTVMCSLPSDGFTFDAKGSIRPAMAG